MVAKSNAGAEISAEMIQQDSLEEHLAKLHEEGFQVREVIYVGDTKIAESVYPTFTVIAARAGKPSGKATGLQLAEHRFDTLMEVCRILCPTCAKGEPITGLMPLPVHGDEGGNCKAPSKVVEMVMQAAADIGKLGGKPRGG